MKPTKPYDDFPLTPHASGQWCKKIHGKIHYFGRDWKDALRNYEQTITREQPIHGLTLADLCNLFLTHKEKAVDAGEIKSDTWKEYKRSCALCVSILGRIVLANRMSPQHFVALREQLASEISNPKTLMGHLTRLRVMFAWAYDAGYVEQPLRYRVALKRPSFKQIRQSRTRNRQFTADEIRKIIAKTRGYMTPASWLGINCGMGNTDVCFLKWENIDGEWLLFPRPKTGVEREAWLWPETRAALAKWKRESPESEYVVCGERGQRLAEEDRNNTPVAHLFRDAMTAAKVDVELVKKKLVAAKTGRGFYSLRHTYRTIADDQGDQPAILRTMGHADNTISGGYRSVIKRERLKAVVEYVRLVLTAPRGV